MKIDLSKFRHTWWEDAEGKEVPMDDDIASPIPEEAVIYWSCFPCTFTEHMMSYDRHPEGIQKFLVKLPIVGKFFLKKVRRTFRSIADFNTNYSALSGKAIVNMVNSGEYTLEQAIWVMAKSCERCGNVLLYKYTDKEDGYPEDSDEFRKCNTSCLFCEEEYGHRNSKGCTMI